MTPRPPALACHCPPLSRQRPSARALTFLTHSTLLLLTHKLASNTLPIHTIPRPQLFERLAGSPELALHYVLQPGDIQLLSNHTCLHHRTAFEDWEEVDRKRHLLRLWLSPAQERELPPVYGELYGGSLEVGNRGAIHVDATIEHVTEEAE